MKYEQVSVGLTSEEIEAIRQKYEKANIIENLNGIEIIAADKEDVPKLLEELEHEKKCADGYHNNWMKAIDEIERLRKENKYLRKALSSCHGTGKIKRESDGEWVRR